MQTRSEPPTSAEEQPFGYIYSDGLGELLEQLDISLLVSTYQAGKLCTFRSKSGQIKMLPRTFKKAMGVAADRSRIAVATQHQIWFLHNEPVIGAKLEPENTYDACYIPRRSHVTSNIDLHEIAWGGGELWLVNTLFSCLATIDNRSSFVPRWHPPFVKTLSRHDRCHLNGVAMFEGAPEYVTMFAATDTPQGWREHKRQGGIIMHVGSGEIVADGLSMPHSPRIRGRQLWALDSGNGGLICVDIQSGRTETVTRFNSYPRGLAFCGCYAFVGLSQIREQHIFGGVPIADESRERRCGVAVVDLRKGSTVGRIEFERSVAEIFDIQVLQGIRFPTVVGFDQDTIERAALIDSERPIKASPSRPLPVVDKESADKNITLGLRHLRAGRKEEAAECFAEAVKLAPDYPRALNNLGYVMLDLGDVEGANRYCQQAVNHDPDYPLARNNLGNALRARGDLQRARGHYAAAVRLKPDYAHAHHNLGAVLCDLHEFGAAEHHLRQALGLQPDLAIAWNRLGEVQLCKGQFDNAMECHDRAITMEPDNLRFRVDRALGRTKAGRLTEAVEGLLGAIEMDPDNAEVHFGLALAYLMTGDYARGWREYEWRLCMMRGGGVERTELASSAPRKEFFPYPPWQGERLDGRTLLIWAEQGIGDEFMFASMFGEIIPLTTRCVIECDHRSIPLMSRSFPHAQFVGKSSPPREATQSPDIDFSCAMGSLGRWLRSDEASFAKANTSYLKADPEVTERLRDKYKSHGTEFLVGVLWRTANPGSGWQKNTTLDQWHKILVQPRVRFVNLQNGECTVVLEEIRDKFGVEIVDDADVDTVNDLDTFAAQVAAMDLIVSVDNPTVHLAGALGRPVWTLLPYSPDWCWMLGRDDSLWYPTMKLFRQPEFADWDSVFDAVAREFEVFVGDGK